MYTDRRLILNLIAMGRITPAEAERLLAAWNESRETALILTFGLALAFTAQLKVHWLLPALVHLLNTQVPALVEPVRHALSPFTDFMGGLL
jgi:hypothetical protein